MMPDTRPHRAAGSRGYDAVVVGGRVAGAATALQLARRGHHVLVVDRARFPSDTLSTHAIARTGVVQLHRWGLLERVLDSGAPAIREVIFHQHGQLVRRAIKERHGVDLLVAPRRVTFDQILLDAARQAGADVSTGVTIDGVLRDRDGRASGVIGSRKGAPLSLRARFVIGADGLRSRIAQSVGAEFSEVRPSGGATYYAYFRGQWPAMEYYLADRTFAGIFPTHDGEACVWTCLPTSDAKAIREHSPSQPAAFDAMVRRVDPDLAARLAGAERTSPVRGTNELPNHIRTPVGPGWALVGDAGYHRDAITGHGISDALRDADLLAMWLDHALRGDIDDESALGGYHEQRDELLREIFDLTVALSQFPPPERFRELQKQLAQAIDDQAGELAAGLWQPYAARAAS